MKKVTIFGTGYVGLVSGVCLADIGHQVVCVDIDEDKIQKLTAGECPIYEPGLRELLKENVAQGRISFTTDVASGVAHGEIIMSAVGTPPMEDGSADLQYVLDVASSVAQRMGGYKVIITKSTVPVGTGEKVEKIVRDILEERGINYAFDVVSNPEFLKEGSAVIDFHKPDRIIVGTQSEKAKGLISDLYKPLMRQENRLIFMDRPSAEFTKYAANSLLATKISFMNELSQLAEKVGADITQVRAGIGSDPRIGKHFIYPGPGCGGSCFPKDVQALINTSKKYGLEAHLLNSVETVNQKQPDFFVQKILGFHEGAVKGKHFAMWGLAFKEETDDVRKSLAVEIAEALVGAGAKLSVYDPEAMDTFKSFTSVGKSSDIVYGKNEYEILKDVDGLIIATPWKQFRAPDFDRMKDAMNVPLIVDGRNLYDPEELQALGFSYLSIGRRDVIG